MRKFIRHPADIPIEFNVQDIKIKKDSFNNISLGGLAFSSQERIEIGRLIDVHIPTVTPAFSAAGRVAWCRKRKEGYEVGIQFVDIEDAYRVRMVEQICHIEHYKKEIFESQGRLLSGEEAAMEWISKFASRFPIINNK